MKSAPWQHAVRASADPARAEKGFSRLAEMAGLAPEALTEEHARIVAALFAGSPAMTMVLFQHPEWIATMLAPENLEYPRKLQGLQREVDAWLEPALQARDYPGALAGLRQFKQREQLRIAARDLARLGDAPQITRELSDMADVCLSALLRICWQQGTERFGTPYHQDAEGVWRPTQFAVLGLGKLGGQELNYSSDVDVMFVYSEEGSVFKDAPRGKSTPKSALSNHQFFKRLAEAFVAEVTRGTEDGALYRIDLRLRPEGESGPLVRSLGSYESFYAQWGQTWERMMLIKARCVAGDTALVAEFLEMIQAFRYPRSLGEGALREIASMKVRIEKEVVRTGELDRNVKLGRGGIREIEFVVQTVQLLHAGRIPFLQGPQTLPALKKLAEYRYLTENEAGDLAAAYCFLRDVEHRVQMEHNLQTHTVPAESAARDRLSRLMGFAKRLEFESALKQHNARVRGIYERFVESEEPEPSSGLPGTFRGAEQEWKKVLADHRFKDVDKSFRLLEQFANGPGYVHVSQRTTELAMKLVPKILALCRVPTATELKAFNSKPKTRNSKPGPVPLSDPDRVLARLDSFITAYGARAVMFETWSANPQIFDLLLLLFDRSEFLAEISIRTPDLVDELVLSGRLGRCKSAEEILADLRHGRNDADQRLWIRRYHEAEFMRIGLRSILGLADYEQNFLELSALADACLQYALDVALQREKFKDAPLVIVGLGKLGGRELNYGSDLDIIFVADDTAKRSLPKLQKVAVDVMDLLGSQTELGIAFLTDARLRPDGEKGLLVNTLPAYAAYYRSRAQLWEIQALTRTRPIAGDLDLGDRFQTMVTSVTDFRLPPAVGNAGSLAKAGDGARTAGKGKRAKTEKIKAGTGQGRVEDPSANERRPAQAPVCYTPAWKQEIARMRARIEKERTPPGQDALAFKTGIGGVMDAEFIAQAMCLEHGWHEPNTLVALQRLRGDKVLAVTDADKLIDNYRQLRRLESILRRWSFEGEAVLPVDPAPYYRVSVRCGFESPEAFRKALAGWRKAIREVYAKVFGGESR